MGLNDQVETNLIGVPECYSGSRGNAEMIRGLLAALSPYLAGEVLVQFDEVMHSDRLELYLLGEPGFTGDGVAVFRNK